MRNYGNLTGLEQWYFSLIWNAYMWNYKTFAGSSIYKKIIAWFVRDISKLSQITYNNFEISLLVFMPNTTTNHAITYTNTKNKVIKIHTVKRQKQSSDKADSSNNDEKGKGASKKE